MKSAAQITFILFLFLCLGCKKYPENNLWFKNPERIYPFTGYLREYRVNGIDSLDLLNNFIPDYPGAKKDIRSSKFNTFEDSGNSVGSSFSVAYIGSVPLKHSFVGNKKYMNISNGVDTLIFNKNLFIDFNVKWKIIRLSRNGPFKIETTLSNGNKYEITID